MFKSSNTLFGVNTKALLTNLRRQGGVIGVGDHSGAAEAGVGHGPDPRPAPPGHAAVVSPGTETDADTRDVMTLYTAL